jgi:hypothetical protein
MDNQLFAMLLPWLMFIPFFVLLAVNSTRRLNCPDCGQPLSPTGSPFTKTRRQWIEGGYLCRNCGCEVDNAGKKVPPGTPLRFGSFIRTATLMVTLLAVGAVLNWFIITLSLSEHVPPPVEAPLAAKAPPPMEEPLQKFDPPPIEPAR